jgi:proliferating cell nuclear antigen
MFEITFKSSKYLRQVFETISIISSNVNLNVSSEGISMKVLDSDVIYSITFLSKKDTDKYVFEAPVDDEAGQLDSINIGINLEDLCKFLKFADGQVTFKYNPDDASEDVEAPLKVSMNKNKTKLELALTDVDINEMNAKEFDSNYILSVKPDKFLKVMANYASIGSNDLDMHIINDKFHFKVTNNKIVCEDEYETDDLQIIESAEISRRYSIAHIQKVCKAGFFSDKMQIKLGIEAPLTFYYQNDNGSYILYYVAPKIDQDD